MADRVDCPQCKARLVLPSIPAGQSLQCARCEYVFVPSGNAAMPQSHQASAPPNVSEDPEPAPFVALTRITGEWKAAFVCVLLGLCIMLSGASAWLHGDRIETIQAERNLVRLEPLFRFGVHRIALDAPDDGVKLQAINAQLVELGERAERNQAICNITRPVQSTCNLVLVIAFAIWIVQAYRNLRVLHADGLHFTPFAAAISIFVPIANLFQPYQAVMEVWRASDPTAFRTPRSWQSSPYAWSIRAWWFLLIAAGVSSFIGTLAAPSVFEEDNTIHHWMLATSCVAAMAAHGTQIYIVRAISRRQRERYERLYSDEE